VLAVSAIETSQKSSTAIAILIPIVVLGLPIADTLLAMWRRGVRGAPLFQADRGHIHHRLLDAGLSQRAACLALWGTSVLLGLVALALAFASSRETALVLVGLGLTAALVLRRLGYLQIERTAEVLVIRRKNLERRAALSEVAEQLKHAAAVGMVWESVRSAAPALGADCVCLRVEQQRAYARPKRYACGGCIAAEHCLFCTRHPLRGERPEANMLGVGWHGGPEAVDHDTAVAVDMLCDHVRNALSRIESDGLTRPASNDEISLEAIDSGERASPALGKVIGLRH